MPSQQGLTGDLRSVAKDFNRDKNSKAKWAHGQSFGPGRRLQENRPRPARVIHAPKSTSGFNKARTALKNDIACASGDSSADEDVEHPSTAPAPDAEIAYSYDASRGPSHGSQILGAALDQAVEQFEVRQTDKLIREEYEVLSSDEEPLSPGPHVFPKGTSAEDEEYEFINA